MDPRRAEAILAAFDQRIAALSAIRDEIKAVIEALSALEGETLFNLGAGVLVPAKYTGGKLLVSIGANVFVERDVEGAKALLEERLKRVEEAIKRTVEERNRFLQQLRRQANAGRAEKGA